MSTLEQELAEAQSELEELRAENRRLKHTTGHLNFLDSALDGFFFTNKYDEVLFVNRTLLAMLGYEDDERGMLIGQPLAADHWSDDKTLQAIRFELERSGFVRDYRVEMKTVTGQPLLISASAILNLDARGETSGIQYTLRPLPTRSRSGTAELRAENRELAALTAIGASVLSTMNVHEVAQHLMETALDLFDVEIAVVFLRQQKGLYRLSAFSGLSMADAERIERRIDRLSEPPILLDPERSYLFQQRETIPPELLITPNISVETLVITLLLAHEKPVGALVMASEWPSRMNEDDLQLLERIAQYAGLAVSNATLYDDLQAAYDELQQAQAQLVDAERQKVAVEMAGAAAHELNQPLTVLLGYSNLLLRNMSEEEPNKEILEKIERNTRKVSEIVRRLGQITRYRTREYVGEQGILDIEAASRPEDEEPG